MKMSVRSGLLVVAAIACLSFGNAMAGAYVGASLGQSGTQIETGGSSTFDASDTAFKIQGGYRFMSYFGVEADYRDLGSATDDASGTTVQTDTSSIDVFAVGVWPLGKWELFGKAGFSNWQMDMATPSLPGSQVSDDGTDLALGVGVSYMLTKVAFRFEYEQFDTVDGGNADMITAGFDWRF